MVAVNRLGRRLRVLNTGEFDVDGGGHAMHRDGGEGLGQGGLTGRSKENGNAGTAHTYYSSDLRGECGLAVLGCSVNTSAR